MMQTAQLATCHVEVILPMTKEKAHATMAAMNTYFALQNDQPLPVYNDKDLYCWAVPYCADEIQKSLVWLEISAHVCSES